MTTIIATKDKILSDGKVTWGGRVDSLKFKKVRNIGNYLVGGAGRATSVLKFFDWWEHKVSVEQANAFDPNLRISVLPDELDEDFNAIVITPEGEMFHYEGNDITRAMKIDEEYYSIGSGSGYALAALKAGASPEKALDVAKEMDCYSGGETFVEGRVEFEDIPETREAASELTKEQLLDIVYGKEPEDESLPKGLEEVPPPIHIQTFPIESKDSQKEKCLHLNVEWDTSTQLLSSPPKYKGKCKDCSEVVYDFCDSVDKIEVALRKMIDEHYAEENKKPATSVSEEDAEMIINGWTKNLGQTPLNIKPDVTIRCIFEDGKEDINSFCWLDWELTGDKDGWDIVWWKVDDE